MTGKSEHFKGKSIDEHLKDAKERGKEEMHATKAPEPLAACVDSMKETAIVLLGFWLLLFAFQVTSAFPILIIFSIGWVIWKGGRVALAGWERLEHLHELIEQERYEIEHHRAQEREELRAMYAGKGFSGALLDQVVEVLMADNNRLLLVMLEEELGLSLETYEHPLKHACGSACGALISAIGGLVGAYFAGIWGIMSALVILFGAATWTLLKKEGHLSVKSMIWNFAVAMLAMGAIYLMSKWGRII